MNEVLPIRPTKKWPFLTGNFGEEKRAGLGVVDLRRDLGYSANPKRVRRLLRLMGPSSSILRRPICS
jgi:hypothetical protein